MRHARLSISFSNCLTACTPAPRPEGSSPSAIAQCPVMTCRSARYCSSAEAILGTLSRCGKPRIGMICLQRPCACKEPSEIHCCWFGMEFAIKCAGVDVEQNETDDQRLRAGHLAS